MDTFSINLYFYIHHKQEKISYNPKTVGHRFIHTFYKVNFVNLQSAMLQGLSAQKAHERAEDNLMDS